MAYPKVDILGTGLSFASASSIVSTFIGVGGGGEIFGASPFCQLAILSTCHFINLPFYQLDILSAWHFINLTFYQLDILPA
jgi:hypothetical protein